MPFAEIVIADCNLAVRSSAIPKVARNALSASYSLCFVRYFVSVSTMPTMLSPLDMGTTCISWGQQCCLRKSMRLEIAASARTTRCCFGQRGCMSTSVKCNLTFTVFLQGRHEPARSGRYGKRSSSSCHVTRWIIRRSHTPMYCQCRGC